jgi:hypothetical protein
MSGSKPSWRERQKQAEKPNIEINEINFPSMNSESWETQEKKKKVTFKSFASLAKEWNEKAEEEKQRALLEEEERRKQEARVVRNYRPLYSFGTSHAREEDTYYETEETDEQYAKTADTSDDWRTVSKKIRKTKSVFEQQMFRPPTPPPPEEQESVWNTYEE